MVSQPEGVASGLGHYGQACFYYRDGYRDLFD